MALDEPELSPRELATRFPDTANYFVSVASVYRRLKAHDLITSPAYIIMNATDAFKDKMTAPNQLRQTDYLSQGDFECAIENAQNKCMGEVKAVADFAEINEGMPCKQWQPAGL